jgi:hypothetical protein
MFRHTLRRLSTGGGFGSATRRCARRPSGVAGRQTLWSRGLCARFRVSSCPVRGPNPLGAQHSHHRPKDAAAVDSAPRVCPAQVSPRRDPECWQHGRTHRAAAPLCRRRCGACGLLPSCRRRSRNPKSPLFCRLDRLAVDDCGAGCRRAPFAHANLLAQRVVDSLPDSLHAPLAKVPVNASPRRIFPGQVAPLAARAHRVQASH